MGLGGNNVTRLLCYLKKKGVVDYTDTLTLGRQGFGLNDRQIKTLYNSYSDVLSTYKFKGQYCEKFIRALGGKNIDSIDASDFEGATIVHDLNKSVSKDLHNKYSAILDGGTTEHVFDFPMAMKNVMKMLKKNGVYVAFVPSNQWNGHGFYQFSAALYIQMFCKANGFKLENIYFSDGSKLWELIDKDASKRIEIVGNKPLEIFVVARKISDNAGDEIVLQQGDYVEQWSGNTDVSKLKAWAQSLPWTLQLYLKYFYLKFLNKKQLKRIRL